MPDTPEQRIADAIIAYAQEQDARLPGYGDDPDAGQVYAQVIDDAGHIAITITTALGLTEEWGWQFGDGHVKRHPTRKDAEQRVAELNALFAADPHSKKYSAGPRKIMHRQVTPWRNAEEEQ